MNEWTKTPWTSAHLDRALALMSSLPSRHREADDAEIVIAGYAIGLEGVTAYGLTEATKAALRGEHGSAFLPSPPELRALAKKAEQSRRMAEYEAAKKREPRPGFLPVTNEDRERRAEHARRVLSEAFPNVRFKSVEDQGQ